MNELPNRTRLPKRVEQFTHAHPEILITAPDSGSHSQKWEVSEPSRPARAWDSGTHMMDDLEARYPK